MSTNTVSPDKHVQELLPKLRSGRVTYFPIRHHSPACASHIEKWILKHRPAVVLIEGPGALTERIEFLTHEQCKCPVAVYTSFVDKKGRLSSALAGSEGEPVKPSLVEPEIDGSASTRPDPQTQQAPGEDQAIQPNENTKLPPGQLPDESLFGPPRFAAYYPFCDYSPELVALRTGARTGAKLRFIDLEYAEMILSRYRALASKDQDSVRIESLAEDPHLKHSQYINALASRMGCRDFNELWDHLFEGCADNLSCDAFIDRVATYCAMARLDYTADDLERDGTTAREACMASIIQEELAATDGQILVVTGGFHTVVLPDLVNKKTARPRKPDFASDETGCWLMRYSFDQLDALAGYSAGMPSPAFYDRMWQADRNNGSPGSAPEIASARAACQKTIANTESGSAGSGNAGSQPEPHCAEISPELAQAMRSKKLERVAGEILTEISRLTRELKMPNLISTPDAMAAMQMTRQLAALRGHPWPLREDVLDAIRSCFVKGEMSVEGQVLFALVKNILAGTRVGALPSGADLPPIVDDFYRQAKRFRLPVESVERREFTLELYRNANHRALSRLFHRLSLLQAPFARLTGGPDFVTGQFLDLIQEHWDVSWSPMVESALIEASIFGGTIEDAAATKLNHQIAALEEEGEGRCSAIAVTLLIRACRLGLHSRAGKLVPLIDRHINEDASLPSVVQALAQLELLDRSREPLEAGNLTAIARLMQSAYHRACRLMLDVARCPNDAVTDILKALQTLREVLASGSTQSHGNDADELLDASLFFHGLVTILECPPNEAQSALVGAAAGILYGEGRLSEEELITAVCGYLGGAMNDPHKTTGILRGLLTTACEIAWQVSEVLRAIDDQFQAWDDQTFLDLLPELRLAFTSLAPRDVARVAEQVSNLHGAGTLGELIFTDIDEHEVHFGIMLNNLVRKTLESEGSGGSIS